jgi:hypothetical protein
VRQPQRAAVEARGGRGHGPDARRRVNEAVQRFTASG